MKITCELWELLPTAVVEAVNEHSRAGGISKIQALGDLCLLALQAPVYGIEPVAEPVVYATPPSEPEAPQEEGPAPQAQEVRAEVAPDTKTVKELRDALAEAGLPVEGTRQELAERLENAEPPDPFEGFNFEGGVGTRLENILRANFKTLDELLAATDPELRAIKGLGGGKTLDLLYENIQRHMESLGRPTRAYDGAVEEEPEEDVLNHIDNFYGMCKSIQAGGGFVQEDVTRACEYYMETLDLTREEARADVQKLLAGVYDKNDPDTFGDAVDAVIGGLPVDHHTNKLLNGELRENGVKRAEANDRAILLFGRGLAELSINETFDLMKDLDDVVQVGEDFVF